MKHIFIYDNFLQSFTDQKFADIRDGSWDEREALKGTT